MLRSVKAVFSIDYRTQWGEVVYISGSCKALGDMDESKSIPLHSVNGENWEIELDLDESSFQYRYWVKSENGGYAHTEFGDPRAFETGKEIDSVIVRDHWRPERSIDNVLYSSPFQKAFCFRKPGKKKTKAVEGAFIRFQLRAPRIHQDYVFGVVGSNKAMGSWNEKLVHFMSDVNFPVWTVDVPISKGKQDFEYKYVVCHKKTKKIRWWDANENRRFISTAMKTGSATYVTDESFQYPTGPWRGAGIAIPVFSLRSEKGGGIGEFTDINLLTDWAVKTGMKIVQILPVNDTTATKTWTDSYPYAAISVNALHPIFANMEAMGRLKDQKVQAEFDARAKKLNDLPEINYEGVLALKSKFFQLSFAEHKATFLKSKEFKVFLEANRSWLEPYAAFCCLRDRYGTSDFKKWEEYAQVEANTIKAFCDPKSDHYDEIALHYYLQFHLDKQLKEASEYARSKGVVLKGDIPIGIYRDSVDAWVEPELFNMSCQAGAPPDDFSISGQNWGFPTYNWEKMAEDGFKWWRERLVKMSEYFDVFRIDHILGFFRIWEMGWEHTEGILGRFNPAIPVHIDEFKEWGLGFDHQRFCEPYIRVHMVYEIFGSHAHDIFNHYLDEYRQGCYRLKSQFNSQRKVKEHFDCLIRENPDSTDFLQWKRQNLYRLLAEVLFIEAPLSDGVAWNPRIAFHSTYSYQELDQDTRQKLDRLYNHFFYHRHNDFWRESAMQKLPAIKEATNMLICGEDLGMVPASVPGVMDELSILSLAIQRMPNDDREFLHPADNPYMSVCSTGSHDMSTLREWWQEDGDTSQRFFNSILGHHGGSPFFCEPWVAEDVINQHMHSPGMLAIFPIQDLLAMDGRLRRELPEEERINVPAISQHYWRYRLHLSTEQLMKEEAFNERLHHMVNDSGRNGID